MRISFESPTTVKMIPENEHEQKSLDALWKLVVRCDAQSKVLCPIGAYVPGTDDGAGFVVQNQ